MKKYRLIILLSVLFLACLAFIFKSDTKELKLTKNMFGCDSPTFKGRVKFIINKTVNVQYVEKKLFIEKKHPLARYSIFYKIETPDKKVFWVCPQLRIERKAEGGFKIKFLPQRLTWRWWVLAFSALLLLVPCAAYPYLQKKRPDILEKFRSIKDWCNVSLILGACIFSLVLLLICSDNIITSASDDPGYFATAIGILNFDLKGPWTLTIGHGFWYMPFILWLKANTFYQIALQFANFSGFIVMPATMVLVYFVVKKISSSRIKALIAVLFVVLFPFFYHYIQDWNARYFKAFCALPSDFFDNRFYNTILFRGYNCMSDTPSTFLIILSLMLSLYLPARIRSVAIISTVYGFACLCRINNIFFAPVIAWLLWTKFTEKDVDIKYLLKAMLIAVAIVAVIFLPQLIINHIQFGSFWTLPYVLHDGPVMKGFMLSSLDTGISFMAGANYAIWAAGLSGMLFIKDRKLRTTLALWAIPVIIFFFGYPLIIADARRFILSTFGAMFAALTCVEVWQEMNTRQRTASFIVMALAVLFVTPVGYGDTNYLPFDLQEYTWGAGFINIMCVISPLAAIALAWYLRKQKRAMFFMICLGVLFYAGSLYLLAIVMTLVLIRALYDWGVEIYKSKIFAKSL